MRLSLNILATHFYRKALYKAQSFNTYNCTLHDKVNKDILVRITTNSNKNKHIKCKLCGNNVVKIYCKIP